MKVQGGSTRREKRTKWNQASNTIRVTVKHEARASSSKWITTFDVGADQFRFHCPSNVALACARSAEHDLSVLAASDAAPTNVIGRLSTVGIRFTECLLGRAAGSDEMAVARAQRADLASALSSSDADIEFQLGVPLPIELLAFERPINGIGQFDKFLGGRARLWSKNGMRRGRVLGTGAVLFHDNTEKSCYDNEINDTLSVVFGDSIDVLKELTESDGESARQEIERAFCRSSASWMHFQCHADNGRSGFGRHLRFSTNFRATPSLFGYPHSRVTGLLLNVCSATKLGSESLDSDESWTEFFAMNRGVPAVIGPLCEITDERSMVFTNEFYQRLAKQTEVLRAFWDARASRLELADVAGFAYRYVGPPDLVLPPAARISTIFGELKRAA